ncbi:glycosyltransferase 87 family protein [Corynebacterium bovis]|uniref:glycosyltransferase 87 family protein n=1 Tax=Corynebacterium bovis TaxID=36808 RepID=UPI00313A0EDE
MREAPATLTATRGAGRAAGPAPAAGTARAPRRAAAVVAVGVAVGVVLLVRGTLDALTFAHTTDLLDLGVFTDAGAALARGRDIYGAGFPSRTGYRFIYPPFAAGLFVALTWLPQDLCETAWTAATVVAVWGIVVMGLGALVPRWRTGPGRHRLWLAGAGLTGYALLLEPVQMTLLYGQINVFLFLLVTADVLGYVPARLRGTAVGVAAGVKITPAAYALYFLATRQWGNLLRSLAGFLGTVVVGFLLRPADSVYFWTTEAFDTGRAGTFWAPPNLALTGVLTRAGVDPAAVRDIMVPGLALFAVLAFVAVRALTDRGGAARGGSVTALTVLLLAVSLSAPVAVTHHWAGVVIVVPLVFALGHRVLAGTAGRSQVALLVAGLALYVVNVSPGTLTSATYQVPLNHRYLVFPPTGPWGAGELGVGRFLVGGSQSLVAVVVFAVVVVVALSRGRRDRAVRGPGEAVVRR